MSRWRLLYDEGAGAAAGLAVDEALMLPYGRHGEADVDATLRLYTYRSHCALVGRYQSLEHEVDLDACREAGVAVGRRPTGGGAIVMGAGQLGVAVTTRAPADASPREVLRRYADGVIAGLAKLGVEASFRSKNDLEVGGRKIAGLGLYLDEHGALLFHTSVLASLDVPFMLSVLNIPGVKLSHRGLARVADRITTVSGETGRELSGADLRPAIAEGFAEALGITLEPSTVSDRERQAAAELETAKYGSEEWVAQRSPRTDAEGTVAFRTPDGVARVFVGVSGDAIKSVLVTGDYNAPPPLLGRLEAGLRWCPARAEAIAGRVESALDGGQLLGCDAGQIAEAVWDAAQRAVERGASHPQRSQGSCYFPEAEVSS